MDEFRQQVKDQVVAANRGPFGGWWQALLDIDPELLRRVHLYLEVAETSGPLPEALRHLVWTAADAVVTHLYPRGLGVHAAIAIECGASVSQVIETLAIATTVSSRGYGLGLTILTDELEERGLPPLAAETESRPERVRERLQQQLGHWPGWMDIEANISSDALEAFLDLASSREAGDNLTEKWRQLIFIAAASCPAIADTQQTRLHIRRALEIGASSQEIQQTLRLANTIALHSISEGIVQLQEHGIGTTKPPR